MKYRIRGMHRMYMTQRTSFALPVDDLCVGLHQLGVDLVHGNDVLASIRTPPSQAVSPVPMVTM